jgi:hypothetical protein
VPQPRQLVAGCPGSISGQVIWDLWWTKRHWGRFPPDTSVSLANSHSTHHLSSAAGILIQLVADVPSGLRLSLRRVFSSGVCPTSTRVTVIGAHPTAARSGEQHCSRDANLSAVYGHGVHITDCEVRNTPLTEWRKLVLCSSTSVAWRRSFNPNGAFTMAQYALTLLCRHITFRYFLFPNS